LSACMFTAPLKDYYSLVPSYGDERPFETPLPVNLGHKKIAVGSSVTVGVKEDGTVWVWGFGTRGSFGNGEEISSSNIPQQIQGLNDVIEVDTGGQTFYALKRDGTVWSWGLNDQGQLGYDTPEIRLSSKFGARPGRVEGLNDIISIEISASSAMALSSLGDVYIWGVFTAKRYNKSGLDGVFVKPRKIVNVPNAKRVVRLGGQNAILTQDGDYFLCCQEASDGYRFTKGEMKVSDISTSGQAEIYLLPNGHILARGGNSMGGLGQGDTKERDGFVRVKNIGRIVDIDATVYSPIALDEKGNIWQWGGNVRYPHTEWNKANVEPLPVKIATIPSAKEIFGGEVNAVMLESGDVYFWGSEKFGLRGTGKDPVEGLFADRNWAVPEKSLWQWK